MIKFIIVIGRKSFSNRVVQSNYWIIQSELLTVFFKALKQKTKEVCQNTEMITFVKI